MNDIMASPAFEKLKEAEEAMYLSALVIDQEESANIDFVRIASDEYQYYCAHKERYAVFSPIMYDYYYVQDTYNIIGSNLVNNLIQCGVFYRAIEFWSICPDKMTIFGITHDSDGRRFAKPIIIGRDCVFDEVLKIQDILTTL